VVIGILLGGGLRWLLIGAALVVAWYILAPLFTPAGLARRGEPRGNDRRRTRRKGRKNPELEVIEGDGRIVD
jgi:hypothetical protein